MATSRTHSLILIMNNIFFGYFTRYTYYLILQGELNKGLDGQDCNTGEIMHKNFGWTPRRYMKELIFFI